MPDEEVVTPEPTAEVEAAAAPPETQPVQPEFVSRQDFMAFQSNLEQTIGRLAQSLRPPEPAPQKPDDITDEELWALAQQNNRKAFELYQERIADRRIGQALSKTQKQQATASQLSALVAKYPELTQRGHGVNDKYLAFYQTLRQLGSPDNQETQLDAALRAVADSRELFAARPVPAARQPQTGQMAPSHRQQPASSNGGVAPTPKEIALAQKMGVKDPKKAMQKFWERNAEGRSRISPNIAAALNMDGQPNG